jgi:hypothetical protein
MKRKFKINYPTDHSDPLLAGTRYKPPEDHMVVMSGDGVFFLICGVNDYYPYVKTLSKELPKYDVVWNDKESELPTLLYE